MWKPIALGIVALFGVLVIINWYDNEFGKTGRARAAARKEAYETFSREKDAERSLSLAILDNCKSEIRSRSDAATLIVNWDSYDGKTKTEGGWKADLRAEDSTGAIRLTCYTDDAGKVLRMRAK